MSKETVTTFISFIIGSGKIWFEKKFLIKGKSLNTTDQFFRPRVVKSNSSLSLELIMQGD